MGYLPEPLPPHRAWVIEGNVGVDQGKYPTEYYPQLTFLRFPFTVHILPLYMQCIVGLAEGFLVVLLRSEVVPVEGETDITDQSNQSSEMNSDTFQT